MHFSLSNKGKVHTHTSGMRHLKETGKFGWSITTLPSHIVNDSPYR